MSKPSMVIVLAEDRRQQNFVWRYLERAEYSRHQIQFEPLPAGKGSEEQWVRQRYAKNVEAYRSRSARAATALVVAIDADVGTVDQHIRELQNEAARGPGERIALLVPRRHIETWVLCLNGQAVDEDADYRHADNIDTQIKPAAATLFAWSRANAQLPDHCVDSLKTAIPEIRRLEG